MKPCLEPRTVALPWMATRKSLQIRAIVVNHEVFLHPSESSATNCIEALSLPSIIFGAFFYVSCR